MSDIHYSVFIFRDKNNDGKYLYTAFFPSFPDINISNVPSKKQLKELIFKELDDKILNEKLKKKPLKQENFIYNFFGSEHFAHDLLTYYSEN